MSTATPSGARRSAPSARAGAASAVPVWVGLSCLVASIVVAVVVVAAASAPVVVVLSLPLPLVAGGWWWLSLVGYALTPVAVIACYGADAIGQRRGLAADANFVDRPGYGRVLLWTVGVGILVGAWHALNLSVPLSEAWGGS